MNIEKLNRVFINAGLLLSIGFGIWHFLMPNVFYWFEYISDAPIEVIIGMRWANFFFSLIFTGYSLLLLLVQKRILQRDIVAIVFYSFIVFIWLCRVIITMVIPWSGAYDMIFVIQLISFSIVFIILALPLLLL
jgi:hypothetical protein